MYVKAGLDVIPVHGIVILDPATGQPAAAPIDVLSRAGAYVLDPMTGTPVPVTGTGTAYLAGSGLSLTGAVFAVVAKAAGGLVSDGTGVYLDTTTATRKFSTTITHDGTTVAFTITHNLNTTDVQVVIRDATGAQVLVDNQANGANTCVVTWAAPQTSGTTFSVIVQG